MKIYGQFLSIHVHKMMMFGMRIIANYPLIKETMFYENLRPIPGNSRSHKESLELRHGTACGASYYQLNDAQYIQCDSLLIHFHTRCF